MERPEALGKGTARLAAYIATQERIDARSNKTRATVKCIPPNTKCGNRCIPPAWDCRLKGEGNDNLLRARRTDPISGFANIERGIKRLGKFVRTGSFSELESSKRSLVRGAVKLKPGTLKEKTDFKNWIEENYLRIVIPLSIASIAIAGHAALKGGSTRYREGMGGKIDDAVAKGINSVLDTTPGMAQGRAYTRNRAAAATSADLQRIRSRTAFERASIAERMPQTVMQRGLISGNTTLNAALKEVNVQGSQNSFYQWNAKHQAAFWGAKKDGQSIFTEKTAHASLNRDWELGLNLNSALPRDYTVAIENRIISDKTSYSALAKQQGYRVLGRPGGEYLPPDQLNRFVQRTTTELADTGRKRAHGIYLDAILKRRAASTTASTIYEDTVKLYDKYYTEVAGAVTTRAGVSTLGASDDVAGTISIANAAERSRIDYLMANQSGKIQSRRSSAGPAHDKLFMQSYYHKRVTRNKEFTISKDDAIRAASELSGNAVRSSQQAIDLLNNSYGFTGARLPVNRSIGRTTTPTTPAAQSRERSARRRLMSRAQLIAARVRAGYSRTEAEGYADRLISARGDANDDNGLPLRIRIYLEKKNRIDFTPTNEREGKPCGKSFISRRLKCSKPTSARYAEEKTGQTGNNGNSLANKLGKGAAVAGGIAAVAGAIANRRSIARGASKGLLQARRTLRRTNPSLYKRTVVRSRVARRVANSVVRTKTQGVIAELSKRSIKALSTTQVDAGISRLPSKFQPLAKNLVGDAKVSVAHIALKSKGARLTSVNTTDNYSNWRMQDGTLLSTGSVGETLIIYNTKPVESLGGVKTYSTQFRVDGEFDAKSAAATRNARGVASTVKKMFKSQMKEVPDNSIITATPYNNDNKGKKRRSIYEFAGFRSVRSSDERLFAIKSKGKFRKMSDNEADQVSDLIRNDSLDSSKTRSDKKCGKSGIPDNHKCTKPTVASTTAGSTTNLGRNVAIGAGVLTAAGAISALALIGVQKGKAAAYRRNVPKSALEAEKLAIEYERQFRDKAAQRLGKRSQDVTGFEASAYDYRDKGYDRGFGSFETDPKWYGQTQQSKGAVVMLSYADERGQGGFKMADGGAFKSVWGDRDILPFSNNISQPKSRSGPDDLDLQRNSRTAKSVGRVTGLVGESAVKTGFMVKDALKRFKFLRDNVNERGFNPDAVRAAAFVVAQRRLTGKSVDIMSYSNGGNVATETLAILQEMGYRDVKVVNIAGPTFGMFNHSKDNMRTWVSEGDDFFKATAGKAYTGGNNTMLKNKNIPHGLQDGIDPNNRDNGANARANVKAKNSYVLDEQLQKEAYQFLTVDKKRSSELVSEVVWRVSEKKPFEGDLLALFGTEAASVNKTMASALSNPATKTAAKERIRELIEDKMLEKWYGGYNPKSVKKAQTAIRKELMLNVTRPARSTVKPKRPESISQRINNLMAQNPGMSREAARNQIMRQRSARSDAYAQTFAITTASLLAARV